MNGPFQEVFYKHSILHGIYMNLCLSTPNFLLNIFKVKRSSTHAQMTHLKIYSEIWGEIDHFYISEA